MSDFAERKLTINLGARKLEAALWGQPADLHPTIVLLHEGLGSLSLWRDFPARLALSTGHPVIAYSRAGYGLSDLCALPRPLDYMAREADDIPSLIKHLGLNQHILVGHSDGGSIAALAAGNKPCGLLGIVLMAPHFFVEDVSIDAIRAAKSAFDFGDLRQRLARHHGTPDAAFRGWNDAWLDPDFRDWNISACIERWKVPALVLQGDNDPYGTSAQVEIVRERAMASEVHLIPNCGHAPHQDAPEITLDLITNFIRRLL